MVRLFYRDWRFPALGLVLLAGGVLALEQTKVEVPPLETSFPEILESAPRPPLPDAELQRGLELVTAGKPREAIPLMERFLVTHPRSAPAEELLGVARVQLGETNRALSHFLRALEWDPRQGTAAAKAGELLRRAGKTEEARALLLRAVQIDPADRWSHQRLGLLFADDGDAGQAIFHLERGLVGTPAGYVGVKVDLGRLYNDGHRYRDTTALLEPVLPLNHPQGPGHLVLGTAYLALGRTNEAVQRIERFRALDPANPRARLALALAQRSAGRPAEALAQLREAFSGNPDWPEARLEEAECEIALGQWDAARQSLEQAAREPSLRSRATLRRGDLERSQSRPEAAAKAYREVLAQDPGNARAASALAALLESQNAFPEAEQVLRAAVAARPDSIANRYRLGTHLALVRHYPEALEVLEAARRQSPADPQVLRALSSVELRLGRPEEAVRHARQAAELRPDHPGLQLQLAFALEAAGQWAEAARVYEALLARSPGNPLLLNNLACALARTTPPDLPRALTLAAQAVRLAPEDAATLDTHGELLLQAGRPAEARPLLEKAVTLSPRQPVIRHHLGRVLAALGEQDAAVRQFREALASDEPFPARAQAEEQLRRLEQR